MIERPAGNITFLFTDIQGSTRLWERHPDAMWEALGRHDDIVRHAIERHRGYVFKTVGDAFYAAFDGPREALVAAADAQRALHAEPWDERTVLRARMALHSGTAEMSEDDYFGPTLNHCARLLDVAWGGQVLLSEAAQELVADLLPDEMALRDLGLHRLVDLRRAEHLYQLVVPGLPAEFPALRTLDSLPNNLPVRRSSFVGREAEMAGVLRLLATTPLLTLIGPGGAGKTRLAVQAGAVLLPEYRDGVWFIELASLSDATLVAQRAANALRLSDEPGRPILDTLLEFLAPRSALLILDNCEHLVAASAHLAESILESCPHVRILATSREPLGIEAEIAHEVAGLTVTKIETGAGSAPASLPAASRSEAVRLFVDRARNVAADFELSADNVVAVAELCRRLDGLPLAIELAAARVRMMTPAEILARLDDRFGLLTGGPRTALPRQQTLRAAIDWSHDLLSADEQALLRRLAVFRGGWTLVAAEDICTLGAEPDVRVLDVLTGLVAKSMVKVEERREGIRYGMLLTVLDYADERLVSSGEWREVGERHAEWYVRYAERTAAGLKGAGQAARLDALDVERDNLRGAFDRLASAAAEAAAGATGTEGRVPEIAGAEGEPPVESAPASLEPGARHAERALRLAVALAPYWEVRARLREGRRRLETALGLPGAALHPALRARALVAAGVLAWQQGDYADAVARTQEGLAAVVELGDRQSEADALASLGTVSQHQSDFGAARSYFELALGIRQELGDETGVASAIHSLGIVARDQGEYVAARSYFGQALQIRRRIHDLAGESASLNALATLAFGEADYVGAREQYDEALAIARALGDQRGAAFILNNLGRVAFMQHDLPTARACLEESLALKRAIGDRRGIASSLSNLAQVAHAEGDLPGAWQLVRESTLIRRDIPDLVGISETLEVAAEVKADAGDTLGAAWLVGASAALRHGLGAPLTPSRAADMERLHEKLRGAVGDAAFDAAYDAGWRATWEEAAGDVLEARLADADASPPT